MSRYSIPAQQPGLTVIVGWDNPLTTFFAQVCNPSIEEDEEALQAQLVGWAAISPDIVDRLTRDQQAATPPTPLQQWAHQLLHGAGETHTDHA